MKYEYEVVVTRRGQTTIPAELRRKYGIEEGTRLKVIDTGDGFWSTSSYVDLGFHQASSSSRVHRGLGIALQPFRVEPAPCVLPRPFRAKGHPYGGSPHISSLTASSTQSALPPQEKSKITLFKSIYLKTADYGILFKPVLTTVDLAGSGSKAATAEEMKRLLDRLREEDL